MNTLMYDTMVYMARPRTPRPEVLGKPRVMSRRVVTFRLHDADHDALLGLAGRAGIGHSALARRIVENYITEHAPRNRRGRT